MALRFPLDLSVATAPAGTSLFSHRRPRCPTGEGEPHLGLPAHPRRARDLGRRPRTRERLGHPSPPRCPMKPAASSSPSCEGPSLAVASSMGTDLSHELFRRSFRHPEAPRQQPQFPVTCRPTYLRPQMPPIPAVTLLGSAPPAEATGLRMQRGRLGRPPRAGRLARLRARRLPRRAQAAQAGGDHIIDGHSWHGAQVESLAFVKLGRNDAGA
jgi:hypothetical protein